MNITDGKEPKGLRVYPKAKYSTRNADNKIGPWLVRRKYYPLDETRYERRKQKFTGKSQQC